jgi:hypothetical protein
MTKYLLLAVAFCCCLSCSRQERQQDADKEFLPFFDVKGFFQEEIDRLAAGGFQIRKTVTIDGQTDTKTLDSLDFSDELRIFLNSDINRVAWFDKYRVDSLYSGNSLERLTYTALEEKLKTREITIGFQDGQVEEMGVLNRIKTAIATAEQTLAYRPATGYSISSKQTIAFSKDRSFTVDVIFIEEEGGQ